MICGSISNIKPAANPCKSLVIVNHDVNVGLTSCVLYAFLVLHVVCSPAGASQSVFGVANVLMCEQYDEMFHRLILSDERHSYWFTCSIKKEMNSLQVNAPVLFKITQ